MIRKILTASLLTLTFTIYGQTKSDEQQIKDVIQNSFDDLWSATKLDKISQYYSTDFMLVENGVIWNTDSVLVALKRRQQRPDKPQRLNKIEVLKVDVDGNHGRIAYFNEATFTFVDKPSRTVRWLESAALKKSDSGWRIHLLHSTMQSPQKK